MGTGGSRFLIVFSSVLPGGRAVSALRASVSSVSSPPWGSVGSSEEQALTAALQETSPVTVNVKINNVRLPVKINNVHLPVTFIYSGNKSFLTEGAFHPPQLERNFWAGYFGRCQYTSLHSSFAFWHWLRTFT